MATHRSLHFVSIVLGQPRSYGFSSRPLERERTGRTETLGTRLVLGFHGRSAVTGKAFSSLTIIVQNVLVCNVVFIITKMFHFWNTLKSADFNGENNTSLDAITKIMKSSLFLTQEL